MAGFTAFLWGFLAIAMKVATADVPVMTIVWFRFTFAFALLMLFVGSRDARRLRILKRPPALGLLAAIALTTNYLGYLAGLESTTPSNAQILVQTAPLMLAIVGVVLFRERLTRRQLAGVVVAVVGFALFSLDQRSAGVVDAESLARGNWLIFGAALAWVVYAALQKHLSTKGWAPQDLNLLLYLLPAVTLWPFADFALLGDLSAGMWVLMLFLGANTLFAYGALGEALKRLPAYQVSVIITLNPLITLATLAVLRQLDYAWVPEDVVGLMGYSAALLVVIGILIVLRKPARGAAG
jgi:drug/metabolite transporter (DMT)-like permease